MQLRKFVTSVLVLITLFLSSSSVAQIIINPVFPDVVFAPATNVTWINNATYFHPQRWLYGAAWDDASGCNFKVTDISTTSITGSISVPPGYATVSMPDIAIGSINQITTVIPPVSYHVAIVYTATTATTPSTSDVFMDVYEIQWIGGFLVTTSSNIGVLVSNNPAGVRRAAHIDMVNKVLGPNNLGTDNFFITWEDFTFSVNGNFGAGMRMGQLATVLVSGTFITPVMQVNTGGTDAISIDVAGIERPVGSIIGDIAIFTFYENTGSASGAQTLYYNTYNSVTNAFTPTIPIDGGDIQFPRIDGKDPITQAGSPNDFEIVYQYRPNALAPWEIRAYSIPSGVYTPATLAFNPNITPFDCLMPTVAATQGARYTYAFWADMNNRDQIVAQQLSWFSGTFFPNAHYYVANMNMSTVPQVAVSCPWGWNGSNYEPMRNLLCWYNSVTNTIDFKRYSLFTPGNPFKSAGGDSEEESVMEEWSYVESTEFKVYPNPASDNIIVELPSGTKAKKYKIMDISGRIIASGDITVNRSMVNISNMAAGLYLLQVDDMEVKGFVKQ